MEYSELMEKYGNEELEFQRYYKYNFTYESENLKVVCGGNRDNIYREEFEGTTELRELPLIRKVENKETGELIYEAVQYF